MLVLILDLWSGTTFAWPPLAFVQFVKKTTQLHALPTFPLLAIPTTIDHVSKLFNVNLHTIPHYTSFESTRYTRQCHLCNRQMSKAKSYYYENMVLNNSATPKQLWKYINQILHKRPAPTLPTNASIKSLCNSFSSHFKDKISLIHSAFTDHTSDIVNTDSPQLNSQLVSFEPATTTEVRNKSFRPQVNHVILTHFRLYY